MNSIFSAFTGALFLTVLSTEPSMAQMKRWNAHCTGGGMPAIQVVIEAINPVQAKKFLQARYPGYTNHYTSSQIYD